jgi:hypothetical protein
MKSNAEAQPAYDGHRSISRPSTLTMSSTVSVANEVVKNKVMTAWPGLESGGIRLSAARVAGSTRGSYEVVRDIGRR